MAYKDKPSIFEANLLYLILGLLLLFIGSWVQMKNLYSGLLITEYILVLLPSLLFLKIKGLPIKKTLKLNRISMRQVILSIGITIFAYPLAVLFQTIFAIILSFFTSMEATSVPMPLDGPQYLVSFFIMAITPGICEEVMFRGIIMDAYSGLGHRKSIFITALLFGIFHFNLMNLVGPIVLGIIFGIMTYKTNSIYSAMIGHTVNNGIALSLGFLLNRYANQIDDIIMDSTMAPESVSLDLVAFIPFLFVVLCFYLVKVMIRNLEARDYEIYDHEDWSFDNSNPDGFQMEEAYDYGEVSYRAYESTRSNMVKYSPVIIITIIFIFINWLYFFV